MRFLVAVAALTAASSMAQDHHPPRSADEYARVLEDPQRDSWQKPHDVIRALNLRADEIVADIGAGSGYFTRRLARHAGKVLAVDVEAKLLDKIKASSPRNVRTVLASPGHPKLAPASVDTVFICDALHHIEARPAYYAQLKAALKPGGRIVIVDFHKKPLPVGPPPAKKLAPEDVIAELAAVGFAPTASHTFLPHQYFLEFRVKP